MDARIHWYVSYACGEAIFTLGSVDVGWTSGHAGCDCGGFDILD